MCKKNAGQGIS